MSYETALNSSKNNILFKRAIENFINNAVVLLRELTEEAFQTPAGKRWFMGQLKIHATIERFYNELITADNRNFLNDKNTSAFKKLSTKFLDELVLIIKSGTGRYITG